MNSLYFFNIYIYFHLFCPGALWGYVSGFMAPSLRLNQQQYVIFNVPSGNVPQHVSPHHYIDVGTQRKQILRNCWSFFSSTLITKLILHLVYCTCTHTHILLQIWLHTHDVAVTLRSLFPFRCLPCWLYSGWLLKSLKPFCIFCTHSNGFMNQSRQCCPQHDFAQGILGEELPLAVVYLFIPSDKKSPDSHDTHIQCDRIVLLCPCVCTI